ncbi:type VII secretion system-associated protein [Saccharopolyspora elongata]|uniref:Type VII secretion system-associated protein n=1 Tax=Saccharopolyspora elongata TaxID=2530387 RepID=A0A4R4ZA03_9PSEU|nr:type VII secretion system-associated protein [Saccharopolyspora elongata]TDD55073.1 type VII secretion system-associated protein [Saccharopolyspora elongata]
MTSDHPTPEEGEAPAGPSEETPAGPDQEAWALVIDPAWQPESDEDEPPNEAVLGSWQIGADGTVSAFQANPDYVPSREDSATDPVDAVLQLVARGDYSGEALLEAMRDALLLIALDDESNAVVTLSPDEVPSVLVATSPVHARRVDVPTWHEITAQALADSLPDEGVDVLLNPGAPMSMRVLASSLKHAMADAGTADPDAGGTPPEPPAEQR